jgi:hypothetical protein
MMQYERYLLVEEMFEQDPRLKKKQELKEYYNELDAETLERKAKDYEERENERLEKKFEKMCEKAEAEGKSRPSKPKVEKKTLPLNRLETKLETLNKRIYHAQTMKIDRVSNPAICIRIVSHGFTRTKIRLLHCLRPKSTTLTLALRLHGAQNTMCRWKKCSPKLCERSSNGLWKRMEIGFFECQGFCPVVVNIKCLWHKSSIDSRISFKNLVNFFPFMKDQALSLNFEVNFKYQTFKTKYTPELQTHMIVGF